MNNIENSKSKNFRDSKKIVLPEPKNYSAPSNERDLRRIESQRNCRANSEMPGNDR